MRKNGVSREMSIDRKEKRPRTGLQRSLIIKNQGDEGEPENKSVKKQSDKTVWFWKTNKQLFHGGDNDRPHKVLLVDHEDGLRTDIDGHC